MAYRGQKAQIPLGLLGLRTDDAQNRTDPRNLISSKNISFVNGILEKAPGARSWNSSGTLMTGGVAAFTDYYPEDEVKRIIVVGKDGKVYRFIDPTNRSEVTASGSAPATLDVALGQTHITHGGIEAQGRARKLFLFTGKNPVQVISGDGTTRADITSGATDWTGLNQPRFGLIYRGRLGVFGNSNAPHRFYLSDPSDQEDFAGAGLITLNVFPGDGEAISGAFIFKGRLFFFKRPSGLYYLDDSNTSSANWFIAKVNEDFGAASPHSFVQVLDDFMVKNQTGSLTSLAATFKFGDLESADVLASLRCEGFFREFTSTAGNEHTVSLYYQEKKQAFYTYFANSAIKNNRILSIDYNSSEPKISLWDFAQANCFSLVKDINGNQRPFFGADDGYIYSLDQSDRSLNTNGSKTAYSFEAQTPHMDLGFMDPKIASQDKLFDHLEIIFRPSGDWNLTVDVYIDGEFSETIQFNQLRNRGLGSFVLGEDKLEGLSTKTLMKPLHGSGRTISFKLTNSGSDQNVKVESLVVYFRVGNNKQKVDPRT